MEVGAQEVLDTIADVNLEMVGADGNAVVVPLPLCGDLVRQEWTTVTLKGRTRKLHHFLMNGQRQKSKSKVNHGSQSGEVGDLYCIVEATC